MRLPFSRTDRRRRRRPRTLDAAELLRRVERIAIASRRRSDTAPSGDYRSVFHGRGMEFSEVREYRPGDDVRAIDGNVTARTGFPHVKLFREERDRTLLFLADLSASEDFGSAFATKRDLAAEAAAAIALGAAAHRDRVGAILFTDRIEKIVRPARGKPHALAIVRDVLSRPLEGFGTDLAAGIAAGRRMLKSRALVVVLSDFRASGWERELGALARRHDVVALALADPAERAFPSPGLFRLRDAETGETRLVDASAKAFRSAWSAGAASEAAGAACARAGVDFLALETTRSPSRALDSFFRARRGAVR
ncbi:MAG TPA: DUF58 domain-containing protein [Thermoanaerobaculia bacterium]|nr:DUF58 domain-containing protein [Thermoanaerobaculia bacterium]